MTGCGSCGGSPLDASKDQTEGESQLDSLLDEIDEINGANDRDGATDQGCHERGVVGGGQWGPAGWLGGGWVGASLGFPRRWQVGGWVPFWGFLGFLIRGLAKKRNPAAAKTPLS
jgi:hypothetical protein